MNGVARLAMAAAMACVASVTEAAFEQVIILREHLGCSWSNDVVHQSVVFPKDTSMLPRDLALFQDEKAIPMQLDNVATNRDGRLVSADVWFRTDLPARGVRTFILRNGKRSEATDLALTKTGDILELANALTAVRLGQWTNGPLLGVRLASGAWAGGARISCTQAVESTSTEILAQGPLFIRARSTTRFAGGGRYEFEVALRSGEPLVRVEERYENAGRVSFDLATGLQPTMFGTEADFRGNMQKTVIDYGKSARLIDLVGWDIYLPDRTSVIGFFGGPRDDLLGWMSTETSAADWLPDPYKHIIY